MSSLDTKIDAVYQAPLGEFVATRAAVAQGLRGQQARELLKLRKPTAVPWAVNQVYWKSRSVYDRVLRSGQALRRQQLAVLQGRVADVRDAANAHRQAVGAAVTEAVRLANAEALKPPTDALARMFEALSLAPSPPASPGRWTTTEHAQGFDALVGVALADALPSPKPHPSSPKEDAQTEAANRKARARAAAAEERTRVEAAREVEAATRKLAERQRAAHTARTVLERCEQQVHEAQEDLVRAQTRLEAIPTRSS